MKIYPTLLAFLFLFFTATPTHSQTVALAPEVGFNLSPIGDADNGQDFRMGLHAGLNVQYQFAGNFSLGTGLFFVQKSKAYQATGTRSLFDEFSELFELAGISEDDFLGIEGVSFDIFDNINGVTNIGYLEIPLTAIYRIGNVEIYAGPYAAASLTARSEEVINSNIPILQAIDVGSLDPTGIIGLLLPDPVSSETNTSADKSGINLWDFGAIGGLALNANNVLVKVQYAFGFVDYETNPESSTLNGHQGLRVSLAYRLGL